MNSDFDNENYLLDTSAYIQRPNVKKFRKNAPTQHSPTCVTIVDAPIEQLKITEHTTISNSVGNYDDIQKEQTTINRNKTLNPVKIGGMNNTFRMPGLGEINDIRSKLTKTSKSMIQSKIAPNTANSNNQTSIPIETKVSPKNFERVKTNINTNTRPTSYHASQNRSHPITFESKFTPFNKASGSTIMPSENSQLEKNKNTIENKTNNNSIDKKLEDSLLDLINDTHDTSSSMSSIKKSLITKAINDNKQQSNNDELSYLTTNLSKKSTTTHTISQAQKVELNSPQKKTDDKANTVNKLEAKIHPSSSKSSIGLPLNDKSAYKPSFVSNKTQSTINNDISNKFVQNNTSSPFNIKLKKVSSGCTSSTNTFQSDKNHSTYSKLNNECDNNDGKLEFQRILQSKNAKRNQQNTDSHTANNSTNNLQNSSKSLVTSRDTLNQSYHSKTSKFEITSQNNSNINTSADHSNRFTTNKDTKNEYIANTRPTTTNPPSHLSKNIAKNISIFEKSLDTTAKCTHHPITERKTEKYQQNRIFHSPNKYTTKDISTGYRAQVLEKTKSSDCSNNDTSICFTGFSNRDMYTEHLRTKNQLRMPNRKFINSRSSSIDEAKSIWISRISNNSVDKDKLSPTYNPSSSRDCKVSPVSVKTMATLYNQPEIISSSSTRNRTYSADRRGENTMNTSNSVSSLIRNFNKNT